MSDPRAIPGDERPLIPEDLVPRQKSDDPVDAERADATSGGADSEDGEHGGDDTIDVEDLP